MSASGTALENLVEIVGGGTPSKKIARYYDGEIPWVTPKDMKSWLISDAIDHITEEAVANSAAKLIPPGAVLVVIRSGVLKHRLPVAITDRPVAINQDMKALLCGDRIQPPYLARFLAANQQILLSGVRATTADNLPLDLLKRLKIPLPPLPEQRRIAAILDKADAVRRKRRQTLDLADQFLRSAFLDLFGDPVTNPMGWKVRKLGDVLVGIEGGWSAKGEDRTPQPGEKAVLKISAVTSGVYRPEECKAVADLGRREVIVPRIGDVLFSRANTRELVAATCLVDRDVPAVFLPDKLWRLVPNTDEIQGPYLRFALNTHSLRALIRRRATGTSGSMLNVSMAKLRGVPIPLPDVARQRRFGRALARQQALIHRAQDAADGCESLASVLTQRAFRGEL